MQNPDTSILTEKSHSLSTRISWGAIFAGAAIAISMQFLLTLLGVASGLSLSDKVSGKAMQNGAVIYLALTCFASLFVGGVVTSLLTGGENTQEAILSGLVMWAVAFIVVLYLSSSGLQGGANVLNSATNARAQVAPMSWEDSARQAGVTDSQINDVKAKNSSIAAKVQDPATQQAALDAATRATWYGFMITWISMAFAALGAYVGVGPAFHVIAVKSVLIRQ